MTTEKDTHAHLTDEELRRVAVRDAWEGAEAGLEPALAQLQHPTSVSIFTSSCPAWPEV